jgi:hypothetical protein
VRPALAALAVLLACQPQGSTTGGLVVVSDTAMIGDPPMCADDTGGSSETGSGGSSGGESGDGVQAGFDPGTGFCKQFTSAAACDLTPRTEGDDVIGECHWVTVIPVLAGTCEATRLYETCVYVPVTGEPCIAAQSCGQIGLGVFGRTGCDGTIEVIVNPPRDAFCAPPSDWPLCWPDDTASECTCVCA